MMFIEILNITFRISMRDTVKVFMKIELTLDVINKFYSAFER